MLVKGGLGLGLFSIIDFPCLGFSVFLIIRCDLVIAVCLAARRHVTHCWV